MLPSLVVEIKQHWGLQQNGANLRDQESSLLIQFLSERNFRTPNRQVLDSLSERVSAGCDSQNTSRPTKKNEALWQRWSPTSNRFWVKNRSYRKQMIKPFLTGARTAFRKSPAQHSTSQGDLVSPSQHLPAAVIVFGLLTSKCALQHKRFPSALQDGKVEGRIYHHFSRVFLSRICNRVRNYRFERAKNEFRD
jgi:hypothetical protein